MSVFNTDRVFSLDLIFRILLTFSVPVDTEIVDNVHTVFCIWFFAPFLEEHRSNYKMLLTVPHDNFRYPGNSHLDYSVFFITDILLFV